MKPDKDHALLFAASGRTSLAQKDYASAVEQLSRASAALPNDAEILCDLGLAYAGLGEYSTGHQQLTKIMKLMAIEDGQGPAAAAFRRLEGRLGQP